jgi:hypothetical protein
MRESCLFCVRKHLSQAWVLAMEVHQGYPHHRALVIGHLGEAADEAVKRFPDLADAVRQERLSYERDDQHHIDFPALLSHVQGLLNAHPDEPQQPPLPPAPAAPASSTTTLPQPVQATVTVTAKNPARRETPPPGKAVIVTIENANCKECERNSKVMTGLPRHAATLKKVAHIAPFSDFKAGYSLVQVVLDHCRASLHMGDYVCVIVNDNFDLTTLPADLNDHPNFMLKAVLPIWTWESDTINEAKVQPLVNTIRHALMPMGRGVVICHDLIFQASFLTHAKAMHQIGDFPAFRIYHLCHSGPSQRQTEGDLVYRYSVPKGQRLLSLTYSHLTRLAAHYGVDPDTVRVLQNPRDLTSLLRLPAEVRLLVARTGLDAVDFSQVLPVSLPRLGAKGIAEILQTLAALESLGKTTRLLVLDAHASGKDARDARHRAEALALELGLHKTLHFASDYFDSGAYEGGFPNEVAGGLFLHTNLFVFPSKAEACPLVVLEAALAGNLLALNLDLPVLSDIIGHEQALWHSFGNGSDREGQMEPHSLALEIVEASEASLPLRSKRHVMANHSLQAIGESLSALAE